MERLIIFGVGKNSVDWFVLLRLKLYPIHFYRQRAGKSGNFSIMLCRILFKIVPIIQPGRGRLVVNLNSWRSGGRDLLEKLAECQLIRSCLNTDGNCLFALLPYILLF